MSRAGGVPGLGTKASSGSVKALSAKPLQPGAGVLALGSTADQRWAQLGFRVVSFQPKHGK